MIGTGLPRDRDVWRIAAPMVLSNVSVPLLGMVDTGVVGHLESAVYIGAVAIGSTIFSFLYSGMNFLRMGTTGIAAQRYGAGDNDGLRLSLGQAMVARWVCGAPAKVLGENTMTKLIARDCHCTLRKLATRATISRPSTLTVTVSPLFNPNAVASSAS